MKFVLELNKCTVYQQKKSCKSSIRKDNLIVDLSTGRSYMSDQDYAAALIDEVEEPKHHNVRFTVGS